MPIDPAAIARKGRKLDSSASVLRERKAWRAFGERFGWRLQAWTYMDVADFILASGAKQEVTAEMRIAVDKAITEAYQVAARECAEIADGLGEREVVYLIRERFNLERK